MDIIDFDELDKELEEFFKDSEDEKSQRLKLLIDSYDIFNASYKGKEIVLPDEKKKKQDKYIKEVNIKLANKIKKNKNKLF
jgi:hypothetical protein